MNIVQQHKRQFLSVALLGLSLLVAFSVPARADTIEADKSAAVVFSYQRIGDDSVQQGNLALEQFKAHIEELKSDNYHVMALPDVIAAIRDGKPLPAKTVALTFEGLWPSTLSSVIPLLTDAKMPFTIFFSPEIADQASSGHASWKQITALKKNKLASFGILPSAYVRLVDQTPEQNAALINRSISLYREKLGEDAAFFAYPYGEYSASLKKQMAGYPFKAVFGQQSGVIYAGSDFNALPRFTMTDLYGDLSRFLLTANALPLPVSDIVPDDTVITQNPPHIGFTVTGEINNLSKLSCFVSGQGKVDVMRLGGNRVELRLASPLEDRTARINCTLPDDSVASARGPSWRWLGMQVINREYVETPEAVIQNNSTDTEEITAND